MTPLAEVAPWRGLFSPNLKRVFRYLDGQYRLVALVAFLALLYIPFALIEPFLLKYFIDRILVFRRADLLLRLMAVMSAFLLLYGLVEFASTWAILRLAQRLHAVIKSEQLARLFSKGLNFFKSTASGRLIFCFFSDSSQIGTLLSVGLATTMLNILFVVLRTGLLLYIAAPLVIIWMILIPIQGWLVVRIMRRVMRYQIEMKGMDEELTARIETMLAGSLPVKSFRLAPALQSSWERVFGARLDVDFRTMMWQRGGMLMVGQLQAIGSFLALLYGVYLMDSMSLTLGDLLAFLAVAGRLTPSVHAIIAFVVGIQETLVGIERYYKVYDLPDEEAEFARARGRLEPVETRELDVGGLDRVEVKDPQIDHGTAIVRVPCAFALEPGRHYVWHGANGAGKTSLALALAGLLPHARGTIRVGGVPLTDFSLTSLHRHILYVGSEPFWPERRLAESFTNDGPIVDPKRLAEALDVTEAGDVLASLPLGLDTVFDNNGRSLSRGESQRLFLALALYRRPEVLILDEVLSSVPTPQRRRILAALRALAPRNLLVYITSTAEEADGFDGEVRFTRRAWSGR